MPKFFVEPSKVSDSMITIDTDDVNHIMRVLRLKEGDVICVCDTRGYDYTAQISKAERAAIVCRIIEKVKSDSEPDIDVTLFQALPKASKMEYIIQKTTELGIKRIVPVMTARCVSKIDSAKDAEKKRERWQKIAVSAAKQSGRGIIPEIASPVTFSEAVRELEKCTTRFVPYECETDTDIRSVLVLNRHPETVGYMIGPEGGFDPLEIEEIKKRGIQTVTLGKRILRTETAGEAVLAMIMYEIGDINK